MAKRLLPLNGRECTVDGCGRPTKARGFCNQHYLRFKRNGDPLGGRPSITIPALELTYGAPCNVDDCDRPIVRKGLCFGHAERVDKYGHPCSNIPLHPRMKPGQTNAEQICFVDGCRKKVIAKGLCAAHYERMRKYGTPTGGGAFRKAWREQIPRQCIIDGCDRLVMARDLCPSHYQRWFQHEDPLYGGSEFSRQNIRKRQINPNGYAHWRDPDHPMAMPNGSVLEHRAVMADMIGRVLKPTEQVHHRNGRRDDNRPGNLELWTSVQPSGQRPLDLLAYAREIVALYPPETEAKLIEMQKVSETDPEFARAEPSGKVDLVREVME